MDLRELEKYDNRKQVRKWMDIYEGKVAWLDDGTPLSSDDLANFGATLVSKIAEPTLLEMESSIVGSKVADVINNSYQDFLANIRQNFEVFLVQGGGILKPLVESTKDSNGNIVGEELIIEYVSADKFIPLKFNAKGDLVSVVFLDVVEHNNKMYTRLERHELKNNIYTIENKAYRGNIHVEDITKEVPLSTVPEWDNMDEYYERHDMEYPLFVYIKTPFANNKDILSPLGASIFSKSEKLLLDAEVQYERIQWEYEATEIAIDASKDFFVNLDPEYGNELVSRRARAFRMIDAEDSNFYKVFSPEIRDESLFNGLNKILRRIESNVGLAYGTLSEVEAIEKTAEEVKAGRETTFATAKGLQNTLENALRNLANTLFTIVKLYPMIMNTTTESIDISDKASTESEDEFLIHFSDSIVVDRQADLMYDEVKEGIINKETYIMRRYGVSLEEAREMMAID